MPKPLSLLAAGAALGGGLLIYAWAGERPRMGLQPYRVTLPGAAGLRILYLSDQHFGHDDWVRRSRLRKSRELMASLRADLILFGGDFLHNDAGLDAVEQLLQALPPAPLGRFAVLGNHDYAEYSYQQFFRRARNAVAAQRTTGERAAAAWTHLGEFADLWLRIYRNERLRFAVTPNNTRELEALLALYDVTVLHNQSQALPGRPGLWIAGVDDPVESHPDLTQTFAGIPAAATVILLSHNPDLAFAAPARRASLILSGHTHGGQVVLPGIGAIHTQGTQLTRQRPAGRFDEMGEGSTMIVSRGMGESTPLRFRCPPEIVVIDCD